MTEIQQLPQKIQYIWCSAAITKKFEDILIGFICNQIQNNQQITDYVFYFSTIGGSPFSAVNLYNFMKSIPQTTTVYNMGLVASAGIPFFLSFKNRVGVPGCNFMIHQTSISRNFLPEQVNTFDLETQKSSLIATDKQTQEIIITETASHAIKPLNKKTVEKAFLNSTNYDVKEAKKYGFIDKVDSPELPTKDIFYLTDQWLATQPG